MTENLQYPIGRFVKPPKVEPGQREQFINDIAATPEETTCRARASR